MTDAQQSAGSCQASNFCSTVQVNPVGSVTSRIMGQNGLMAESIYISTGCKVELKFDASVHLLVMYEEGTRCGGVTSINGLAPSMLRTFADKLTFVPAGCTYFEWHETSAPTRLTFIYVDPAKRNDFSDKGVSFVPKIFFHDAALWETATKLKSVIENEQAVTRRYSEALVEVLLHELNRTEEDLASSSRANRGGLASWQERAVKQSIEENLGEQVSLATLAKLVRLSRHHFCRAFKRSFGTPPHQYIVQRRIERAKLLLADRTNSITEISLRLGYSQTSTFSVAFRKTTGRTAREFRRECA